MRLRPALRWRQQQQNGLSLSCLFLFLWLLVCPLSLLSHSNLFTVHQFCCFSYRRHFQYYHQKFLYYFTHLRLGSSFKRHSYVTTGFHSPHLLQPFFLFPCHTRTVSSGLFFFYSSFLNTFCFFFLISGRYFYLVL